MKGRKGPDPAGRLGWPYLGLLSAFFISALVPLACAHQRFVRLEDPVPDGALLYIIRPFDMLLSIWDFRINIRPAKGPGIPSSAPAVRSFSISNGAYAAFRLAPGYYDIQLPDYSASHMVYLAPGVLHFAEVRPFAWRKFSSYVFIFERNATEAVTELTAYDHMERSDASEDELPRR